MIHETIEQALKTADVILVDCLTLWPFTLMFAEYRACDHQRHQSFNNRPEARLISTHE